MDRIYSESTLLANMARIIKEFEDNTGTYVDVSIFWEDGKDLKNYIWNGEKMVEPQKYE